MSDDLESLTADVVFDGGDLDCGSGLSLLIREQMLTVPEGGLLEVRSREPSVREDLPPWCRLTGHEYVGDVPGEGFVRYLLRRGAGANDAGSLEDDKAKAKEYEWRARVRATGPMKSTVYCRNFSFHVGQPASFEEKDENPSAVEYLLGALAASLSTAFATECSRVSLEVDDVEITVRGKLTNVLAHLGLEEGDPSFESIDLKCFASSLDDEAAVRAAWDRTVARAPLVATLSKAVALDLKLSIL